MSSKVRLGISDAAYLRPLLHGLNSPESGFEPAVDLPAANSVHLNERTGNIRCAFLSPIDYARYGGSYRIVPDVCVSSSKPTRTVTLTVKNGVRNIRKIAVDIRVTSEIILARIVLAERLRNLPERREDLEFIPAMPSLDAMLSKADAALIVDFSPVSARPSREFSIDLVEEWSDMTGLPYVHGFWVAREEDLTALEVKRLIDAKNRGVEGLEETVRSLASDAGVGVDAARDYIDSFGYDFGREQMDSLSEFFSYAYYHGVLGDIPELNFFEIESVN